MSITVAKAKEDAVCPEGKDQSVGNDMSTFKSGILVYGLGLAKIFLSNKLLKTREPIREREADNPTLRVFLIIIKITVSAIHTMPELPMLVINLKKCVVSGVRILFCSHNKIEDSILCSFD